MADSPQVSEHTYRRDDGLVEDIERATLHAVSPDRLVALPRWLLPLDACSIGRTHAAVPLTHELTEADVGQIAAIEAVYRTDCLAPMFRLPRGDSAVHRSLRSRGYSEHDPTWVMRCTLNTDSALLGGTGDAGSAVSVAVATSASEDWAAVFLGPGFDAADGAARAAHLGRASGTRFYSARSDGGDVPDGLHAVGAACWLGDWVGIHGMRTLAALRGRGLARAILRRMAQDAWAAGQRQLFLQVGADNPARLLYQRLGFAHSWTYAYWRCA